MSRLRLQKPQHRIYGYLFTACKAVEPNFKICSLMLFGFKRESQRLYAKAFMRFMSTIVEGLFADDSVCILEYETLKIYLDNYRTATDLSRSDRGTFEVRTQSKPLRGYRAMRCLCQPPMFFPARYSAILGYSAKHRALLFE